MGRGERKRVSVEQMRHNFTTPLVTVMCYFPIQGICLCLETIRRSGTELKLEKQPLLHPALHLGKGMGGFSVLLSCTFPTACSHTYSREEGRAQRVHRVFLPCTLADLANLVLRELCEFKKVWLVARI